MQENPAHTEQPTLLLHGGGVSQWMWDPLLAHLNPAAHPIVRDLPGHGSRSQEPYVSHDTTVAELVDYVTAHHPGGVHVVGFSLGAQLAIMMASLAPQLVRSVVVISAETIPAPLPKTTLAVLKAFLPLAKHAWFARLQARELSVPDTLMLNYVRESATLSASTVLRSVGANITFTLPERWGAFPGPARILVGGAERRLMHRSAQLTHDISLRSTLHVVPNAAHDIPFTHPQLLAELIHETRCAATPGTP